MNKFFKLVIIIVIAIYILLLTFNYLVAKGVIGKTYPISDGYPQPHKAGEISTKTIYTCSGYSRPNKENIVPDFPDTATCFGKLTVTKVSIKYGSFMTYEIIDTTI